VNSLVEVEALTGSSKAWLLGSKRPWKRASLRTDRPTLVKLQFPAGKWITLLHSYTQVRFRRTDFQA
jgi:hypothetical protein